MINKTSRILGVIVLILGFIVLSMKTQAQIIRKGNNFVEQSDSTYRGSATKTEFTYTDSKGNVDTIYLSSKGSAFVWKVSKKTGKRYRKYLPEVTKQLKTIKK